jgi:ADP-heptose:LPS heptosyltransferase
MIHTTRIKGKAQQPGNILIDMPHGLGDQIMCFPLLASLKKAYPDCSITVLSPNRAASSLLSYNTNINDVITINVRFSAQGLIRHTFFDALRLRRKIRKRDFDTFIIVHPNMIRTVNRILCGIPFVIENIEHTHKSIECRNILETLGIPFIADYSLDVRNTQPVLDKFALTHGQYVLLDLYPQHINRDPRRWESYPDLINSLKSEGMTVVTAGINRLHVPIPGVTDLVNKTSFPELLALVKHAKMTVTLDTGFFHFSYALGTPTISLFGPVNPVDRVPIAGDHRIKIIYKKLDCSPCIVNKVAIPCRRKNEPYLCMKSITVDEVMKLVREYNG